MLPKARPARRRIGLARRVLVRRLHPRFLKNTGAILSDDAASMHLSLAHGALLHASPALPALWLAGAGASSPPAAKLVRALFHRHEPQEPLRPTRNQSLPGCHVGADHRLQGMLLALALAGSTEEVVRQTLLSQGVDSLARRTKVSIARFVRLAMLLGQATFPGQTGGATGGHALGAAEADQPGWPLHSGLPRGLSGPSILLALAWATATSRADLLAFLLSLHQHHSALTRRPLLRPSPAQLSSHAWRALWCADGFDTSDACAAPPAGDGLPRRETASLDSTPWAAPSAERLELLAFYLCAQGSDRPEVGQGRYGHMGQPPVADCVESVLHDALSLCLWDAGATAFRPAALPAVADGAVLAFFSPAGGVWRARPGEAWFGICSGRPGLQYMRGGGLSGMRVGHGRGSAPGGPTGSARPDSLEAARCVPWDCGSLPLQMGLSIGGATSSPHGCAEGAEHAGGSASEAGGCYELYPSLDSFTRALSSLVGLRLEPPAVGGAPAAVWPGCGATWARADDGRDATRAVLRMERPKAAEVGDADAALPTEVLRILFHQQVHCYATRTVLPADEPPWVAASRYAWMRWWRQGELPPAEAQPASTLLCGDALLRAAAHLHSHHSGVGPERRGGEGMRTRLGSSLRAGVATAIPAPSHKALHGDRHTADHTAAQTGDEQTEQVEAARAILGVLSAAPTEHAHRSAALAWVIRAGPLAHWTLPLLLRPTSTAGWDDLSLDAVAEQLSHAPAQARLALAAAAAPTPPLAALLALRQHPLWTLASRTPGGCPHGGQEETDPAGALRRSVAACSATEHAQLLRIACGFVGYTATQRLAIIGQVLRERARRWWPTTPWSCKAGRGGGRVSTAS